MSSTTVTLTRLPTQTRFWNSPAKYRAFVGGIGSGKTYIGALETLRAVGTGTDGVIVAPTFPMLRDATQRTLFDLCERMHVPVTFWKSEERARIGKSNIFFRSTDYPDRLRGPNLGWAWVDEGAMASERTWQIILGRLRVGKPRAWVTTTPAGYNWVWRYFVSERRDNYALFRASTRDNRFLPAGYLADLSDNYSGEFARQEIDGEFVAFEGLVYSELRADVHVVDPLASLDNMRLVRGIDYGYTNPFVCLWGAIDVDGRLYIYDEHYRRKSLIREHAEAIKQREGSFEWTVADHDAQDNAEMQACGVWTVNAKKEVIAGIQSVKARLNVAGDGKPRLFICSNCVNLLKELGMYRWSEHAMGRNEKEEPLKENDHACLVAGTMITTRSGMVPIERVRVGEEVLTRDGWKEVTGAGITSADAKTVTVSIGDSEITATPDHLVWANDRWARIDLFRYSDMIDACIQRQSFSTVSGSEGTGKLRTGQTEPISLRVFHTSSRVLADCTRKFGRRARGTSRRGSTSITSMATRSIMRLGIWLASKGQSITRIMASCISQARLGLTTLTESVAWQLLGTNLMLAESGIGSTPLTCGYPSSRISANATSAVRHTRQGLGTDGIGSVLTPAKARAGSSLASITKPDSASCAGAVSRSTGIPEFSTVRVVAGYVRENKEPRAVYNLTVKDSHEFFANGVLVHNCDTLRYMVQQIDNSPMPRVTFIE